MREEQQQEAERQQKLREQEEQRKAEQTKPLTLDEIEFDWQEAEGPKVDFLTSGTDRFVAIQDGAYEEAQTSFYSYDALHWNKVKTDLLLECHAFEDFYCCNGIFIFQVIDEAYYSSDSIHWNKVEVDEDKCIDRIIWTGDHYIVLMSKHEGVKYSEDWGFFSKTKNVNCVKTEIYAAEKLAGPWYKEKLTKSIREGEYFSDIVFFNNQFIANGCIDSSYAECKELLLQNLPVVRLNHLRHRIDHVAVRNRFPARSRFRRRNQRDLIASDEFAFTHHQSHNLLLLLLFFVEMIVY